MSGLWPSPATSAQSASDGLWPGVAAQPVTGASSGQESRAKRILNQPHKNIGDLLDYQRAASQEAVFGGGSSDENRRRLRERIGLSKGGALANLPGGAGGSYEDAPHWAQGLVDWALDSATDPLTYETMGGSVLRAGGARALKAASPLLKYVPAEVKNVARAGGTLLHDFTTYAGKARRTVGADKTNIAIAEEAKQAASEPELARRLQEADDAIMAGLSDREKSQVQRIMHGDLSGSRSSPAVWEAVRKRKELLRIVPALQAQPGSGLSTLLRFGQNPVAANAKMLRPKVPTPDTFEGLVDSFRTQTKEFQRVHSGPAAQQFMRDLGIPIRAKPGERAFTLKGAALRPEVNIPENLREFQAPGQFTPHNIRRAYFPAAKLAEEVSPDREARTFNLLENQNPHLLRQDDFRIKKAEVGKFEDAFKGMLATNARAITVNSLKQGLHDAFGGNLPAEIRELFEKEMPATGKARSEAQIVSEGLQKVVNLPKLGIIGTSPRHMVNIFNMLGLGETGAAFEAFAKFVQLSRIKDPAKRFTFMKPAIEMGIEAPFEDKFTSTLAAIPGLKQFSRGMNKATWDFDAAATWAVANKIRRDTPGIDPRVAGQQARQLLIDYRHLSPLTQLVKRVAPFGTFESQIPFAVAKSIARNPARAEAINRASQGQMLGGGDSKSGKYYGPTAKVGRGALNPLEYGRGLLADPLRLGLAGLEELAGTKKPYMNYSQPLDWSDFLGAATSPLPYARDVLDELQLSHFKPKGWLNELLQSATGVSRL